MADVLEITPRDIGSEGPVRGEHDNPRETTHHMGVQPPTGREDDKKVIVEKLWSNDSIQSSKAQKGGISIISIVGKGGIGKTTLAKMVFKEVKEHFGKCRWWVCVSERQNRKVLVRQILREVCKGSRENPYCSMNDVWELEWWEEEVEGTLMAGAMGSNILITSRKKNVSKGMCASYVHELPEFSFDQSWELFLKEASQTEEDLVLHRIRDVGERIVRKCGGLLLVIKTVGSMMRTKKCIQKTGNSWRVVRYGNGRCLQLKSVAKFFQDYKMERERLIWQWLVHELIEEKEGIDVEMTANQYIDDLMNRCLIEKARGYGYEGTHLTLHNILHDLALYIDGREYSHASATEHTHHKSLLSVHDDAEGHKPNALETANKGELSIEGLRGGRVKVIDAKKVHLKERHELNGVELYFKVGDDDRVGSASEERGLLEALEPPHGIERLAICDYERDRPVWYLDTNYVDLRTLCLERCPLLATVIGIKSLENLQVRECPTFCALLSMPLLKSLNISDCDGLNTIGDLPKLETLHVYGSGNGLPQWVWGLSNWRHCNYTLSLRTSAWEATGNASPN
ncbi:putative disease resistance protein RGA3 [Nymphaea colorata]|nr:putative disease resistance protein RGA3 [Nymphaea colorata]